MSNVVFGLDMFYCPGVITIYILYSDSFPVQYLKGREVVWATSLYFYGSKLLTALKSKITVILTHAQQRYCGSSNYVKVLFNRLKIITITK
jgi:hypothetical protein